MAANRVDRGRQTGALLEPATGDTACPHIAARPPQARDLAGSAKAHGLLAGCGQEWPALSGTHSTPARKHQGKKEEGEKEQKGSRFSASRLKRNIPPAYALTVRLVKTEHVRASFLRHANLSPDGYCRPINTMGNPPWKIPLTTYRWDESGRVFLAGCSPAEPASACSTLSAYQFYVRSVSDPPAGPHVVGDCARELRLLIHPTVCFEAGRFTLTQSSWTTPVRSCSRKWMSGHAAMALVLLRDRGQFATLVHHPLGEPVPPSQGKSPFPVDFYLSWM